MFTGIPQKNKAVAKVYFDEHLSHNDYYTLGEVEVGRWIGEGAQRLGLMEGGAVERKTFMELCDNVHPVSGRLLTQRLNADGNRRVLFDFTCSAPKSVSIMAVTMDDARIVEAHQLAARFGVKELERFASARIRAGNSSEDRETGNFAGAEFLHNSSRALDPQLHTHFTVFNCTFDPAEQRWKALQTSPMFAAIRYVTEVYRNDLAARLHALGYETIRTPGAFEIKGVPQSLCEKFSKRAKERDAMVAQMEQELGRKISNNEIAHAVHKTRSRKLKGISTADVRERQLAQMSPVEIAALKLVRDSADGSAKPFAEAQSVANTEDAALDHATRHIFERRSVVPREALLETALVQGRGQIDLRKLKEKLDANAEFVRVGREVSTREILEAELRLIRTMNEGKDALDPIHPRFIPSQKLGEDQRNTLTFVLQSPDRFTGIRGLAGTGKSTALSELARAIHEAGCNGVFCAPTGSASDVLRKDGFDAITLQRLFVDPQLQAALNAQSVLVLDEAGAVSVEEMQRLFLLAIEHDARVVFSGDTGQHASVSRGDALRILEEHSRYSFGQLFTIRRQRRADYLQAVTLAAERQPAQAFDRLDAIGEVIEQSDGLCESTASAYLDAVNGGSTALIVSPTWAEIESVTRSVRDALKERGVIGGQEAPRMVLDSLSWTDAQKCSLREYRPGQVLVFQQQSGSFARHETAEVFGVKGDRLQLRRADGSTISFRLHREAKTRNTRSAFDVCEQRELSIAPGDMLLLQGNRREQRLINGQIVTVKNIAPSGAITLTDGRILPPDYRTFCRGYAVTSHASQGKTVDQVLVLASSRSCAAVSREQFYVSISRGRQRCRIFTDDKELLRERIVRSASRKAALELTGLAGLETALAKIGFARKAPKLEVVSPPAPTQRPRIAICAVRPMRATRLSALNRLAHAFTIWLAHLKHAAIALTCPMRPSIRHRSQHPHESHKQPSNRVSI